MKTSTLVLTAQEVIRYLPMAGCIDAVEAAFLLLGRGQAQPPVTVGLHAPAGGFHIKAAVLDLGRRYFAVKANGNFPSNPSQHDLPTIQGLVILCDGDNGKVLAVMDSIEITARRTAAATAVAAKYLAPRDVEVAAVCGCGVQAAAQLAALAATLPIERFITVDAVPERAQRFASDMRAQHGLDVRAASFADAVEAEPDVWITCRTSREFFLFPEHVKQGAF
ncbi:MAG TPA: hypothetical protein VI565_07395, partial [Burkholderiales bacterium]|nr:hypothetical protein [Burkholderiales bacterium]